MPVTFDTETFLIREGNKAAELVCLTYKPMGSPSAIVHWSEALPVLRWIWEQDLVIGHYLAYDASVTVAAFPQLAKTVFDAYAQSRATCTKIREQLLDIAKGHFDGFERETSEGPKWTVPKYGLADLVHLRLGRDISAFKKKTKKNEGDDSEEADPWRLRYGTLWAKPLSEWPKEAVDYPLSDTDNAEGVYLSQEQEGASLIKHAFFRARSDFALTLASAWGYRTDPAHVARIRAGVESAVDALQKRLMRVGFVRDNKKRTRDKKAVASYILREEAKRIEEDPEESSPRFKLTPKGQEWLKEREHALTPTTIADYQPEHISLGAGAMADLVQEYSLTRPDGEVCYPLQDYADLGEALPVIAKDVKALEGGTALPIHTTWKMLITDRVGSKKPNIQNWRVYPGIREAFIPREGYVFVQADFGGVELSSLGEVCRVRLGYSHLADAIASGNDPHLVTAASFMGCTLAEAVARHKDKDPHALAMRDMAKPFNFGKPGGLGIPKFRLFAKAQYGIELSDKEAIHYSELWLGTYREMPDYFRYVRSLRYRKSSKGKDYAFEEVHTGRRRSAVRYTEACNGLFQSLATAMAQDALFAVSYECYAMPSSPLYGTRPVNFVHDEIIAESPRATAHLAALRMTEVMEATAKRWMPYAPPKAPPVLMERWSKLAHEVFDSQGRLVPWDYGSCECKKCGSGMKALADQGLLG